MILKMKQVLDGEDEVIIHYQEMNEQIEAIANLVRGTSQKICATLEKQTLLLAPEDILYIESVDGINFAYLTDKVAKVDKSLAELSILFEERGFFRCSKSMILNIHKINYLKSESGNRIRATMENGEQVMISRKYAKLFRQILKGGAKADEE